MFVVLSENCPMNHPSIIYHVLYLSRVSMGSPINMHLSGLGGRKLEHLEKAHVDAGRLFFSISIMLTLALDVTRQPEIIPIFILNSTPKLHWL